MWVALELLLGIGLIGLITTRRAIVSVVPGSSVSQMDLFRYFSEENHHGFLEDIRVKIIDRLIGGKDT